MKYIALILGKILIKILQLAGRNGGSFPGIFANKICGDMLRHFTYPEKTILVTGTNGKTSTSNLIAAAFKEAGFVTIHNARGDNMVYGILSLLIRHSDFRFRVRSEVAVIEIDELTLVKYVSEMKVTDLLITNFFRDQLDRAGEMERIISKIAAATRDYEGNLFLNEDDPNVKRLHYACEKARKKSYSLRSEEGTSTSKEAKEGKFCPLCHRNLHYDYYYYSHIGSYRCENCDFASGDADYTLRGIDEGNERFEILKKDGTATLLHYNLPALYHLYNLLASASVLLHYGVKQEAIDGVFKNFKLGIGRMERIEIKGKNILLNLVKNPTGCNEIIKYMNRKKGVKALLFLLNDNEPDGQDTSWIWDADFEKIEDLKTVILSGRRAHEAALRFKLAGIPAEILVEKEPGTAIDRLIEREASMTILSTYTGLFGTREVLLKKKREEAGER